MAKATLEIRSLARVHTETAIKTLVGIMNQPEAPSAARVAAAQAILDRGWGKAAQDVTLTADVSEAFARLWGLVSDGAAAEMGARVAEKPGQPASIRH